MAIYICADGTEIPINHPQGVPFTHKELQTLCEGTVDLIDMGDNGVLVINAEYYAIGIPPNIKATSLALPYIPDATYIAGPALLTTLTEITNPITVAKFKQLYAQRSVL